MLPSGFRQPIIKLFLRLAVLILLIAISSSPLESTANESCGRTGFALSLVPSQSFLQSQRQPAPSFPSTPGPSSASSPHDHLTSPPPPFNSLVHRSTHPRSLSSINFIVFDVSHSLPVKLHFNQRHTRYGLSYLHCTAPPCIPIRVPLKKGDTQVNTSTKSGISFQETQRLPSSKQTGQSIHPINSIIVD